MCDAPHHAVLARFATGRAIERVATALLGYRAGALLPAGEPERLPFAMRQRFALHAAASGRSALRPSGHLPATVPVEVTAELPSSVTLRFQLEGAREVQLSAHVQPATYDTASVTLVLRRNFRALPGSDLVLRCVPHRAQRGVLSTWCRFAGPAWAHRAPSTPRSAAHNGAECRKALAALGSQAGDAAARGGARHEVLPCTTPRSGGDVFAGFDDLRAEFVTMGYGVPAEVAHQPNRMDQ